MLAPLSEPARTKKYKLTHLPLTAALVGTILSLGNPRGEAQSLDEIFPKVSLGDISDSSKKGLRDLIINNDSSSLTDIREYLLTELKSIGQCIKEDIHNKIMTDADFRSLHDIRNYALAELRRNGVSPTGIEVQILPICESENEECQYLNIVVMTPGDTQNIALFTSEPEKIANILNEIIIGFEKHIEKASLTVLRQEMDDNDFNRIKTQKDIDTVLEPEFRAFLNECYEYFGCHIGRDSESGIAIIYVSFLDKIRGGTLSLTYKTNIVIPSFRLYPTDIGRSHVEWAQNTLSTQK